MAGNVASESIMLIAALVVTTAFVGVFAGVIQDISTGVRSRGDALSDELHTDITIINDPQAISTSPLVLYVKNTGDRPVAAVLTEVLVDGQVSTDLTRDVLGSDNDEVWNVGEVMQITVNDISVGAGDHRVRVVAHNGIEDSFRFNA